MPTLPFTSCGRSVAFTPALRAGLVLAAIATLALPGHSWAATGARPMVLVNHVGYELSGSKKFVLRTEGAWAATGFAVLDDGGKKVFSGKLGRLGPVDKWKSWSFARGDFSGLRTAGRYRIEVSGPGGPVRSEPFLIKRQLLPDAAMYDLLFYFKSQRTSGIYDQTDRRSRFFGQKRPPVDLHGGWFDASGDVSKYLSHLSFANYMNPQQTGFVVWSLFESADILKDVKSERMQALRPWLESEALYGADFLTRMLDPAGYFYLTIFDNWSYDPKNREICAYETDAGKKTTDYQAAMREGAGLAIAALARASTLGKKRDYPPARYLAAAEKGFAHLLANNRKYLDDGKENIIDDYAALLAATELYRASKNGSKKTKYLAHARARAQALVARLSKDERFQGFWRADDSGERPYFHAVEAGLPVLALLRFRDSEPARETKNEVLEAAKKSLGFELGITAEVYNPFGYARQYVKSVGGKKRSAFFIPHKNESGYWWQGESARQASLAAAALHMGSHMEDKKAALFTYAQDQLDWIFGLNPFDVCMMKGQGRNTAEYMEERPNAPGGVANGITAGFTNENDIDFLPKPHDTDPAQRWRWSEQWTPHGAWLMLALAIQAASLGS